LSSHDKAAAKPLYKMPKQYKVVLDDEQEKYVSDNCISVQKLLRKTLDEQMKKDKNNGFFQLFKD
jgi:hypothetical protein